METRLEEEHFLQEYKVFIHKIGGHTSKGNIHNVLTRIFSNECSLQCSWKGWGQNFALFKLHMIAVIKVILELDATLTEKELDDIAAEWFRFGKQRHNRELQKNARWMTDEEKKTNKTNITEKETRSMQEKR
ncbi:uncharacterized protein [Polyergus mexicanus]|uniref:uncharacterized protein n=1 Tax=Polyergus mexicanus TaxID=615972 RepID=UPI0038B612CE